MILYVKSFALLLVTIFPVFSQNPGNLLPKECGKQLSDSPFFGSPTTPANAYPWIVALFYKGSSDSSYGCVGTLINSRYVLTAASCLTSPTNILSSIRIGEWDLRTEEDCTTTTLGTQCLPRPIIASPEDIILHPSYNTSTLYSDDIGLIRLNISLDFNVINYGINPICLPPNEFVFKYAAYDKRAFAAGWGAIGDTEAPSKVVRSIALPVADDHVCSDVYKGNFNDAKQICVGGDGSDTCFGDGGGPLILPGGDGSSFIQVGIVSYGKTPCGLNPSVYTSVVAYKNWILQNLKP